MNIRQKRPDKKNALSIVQSARKEMKFTLSLKITEDSGSTIMRNIYECFRKLGDALLVAQGIETRDHLAPIRALVKLNIQTNRPIQVIENLRYSRHNINYYGYVPKIAEVMDTTDIAKTLFNPLFKAVLEEIEKPNKK
jgi:uncharacterized protein (UPF0332 family)